MKNITNIIHNKIWFTIKDKFLFLGVDEFELWLKTGSKLYLHIDRQFGNIIKNKI